MTEGESTMADVPTAGADDLNEHDLKIARAAAKIAVRDIADEFYKQVGKGILSKVLVWVGLLALGFGMAKGWITFTPPK